MLSKSIVILSLVFIIVHLVFCFLEKNRERKITKCFCVVSIGLIVWALGAKNIFVYFALLFGLLGDLCLIFKDNKKLLVLGMIAFGINHIFYYIGALQKIDNLNSCFYYIIPLVFIIISSIIYLIGKKYFKSLSIPSSLYTKQDATATNELRIKITQKKFKLGHFLFTNFAMTSVPPVDEERRKAKQEINPLIVPAIKTGYIVSIPSAL